MTFLELIKKYQTEGRIIEHFINIRYGSEMHCNHCGSDKVYPMLNAKFYYCNSCRNSFSVFKNTIFEKSDTDLRKWFYAIYLFMNSKKGISGNQLQKEIGVTYKTAWKMLKQIRSAIENKEKAKMFETIIEVDETYNGGKFRKENDNEGKDDDKTNKNKKARGTMNTPVISLKERNSNKVHAEVLLQKNNKKLIGIQILTINEKFVRMNQQS